MKGNNVRKFACRVYAYVTNAANPVSNIINVTATTNLGNLITQTGNSAGQFVGFNVTGSENEYIVSVLAQVNNFPSPAARIALYNLMVGDNTPQNVALNFDGVNDNVTLPCAVGNFATNQDFTISCWIKPDPIQPSGGSFNPNENDIITKRLDFGPGGNDQAPYPFEIRYLNQNRVTPSERNKIRVGQWDGTSFPSITSTTPLNDGKWHHVAYVRESSIFKLSIDGVQEGSTVADNAMGAIINNNPIQIGRRANGQNYFKGEIDEVRFWTVGKTATQIADERFCKTPPNTTNLQASYNFSNGVLHDNNALITQVQDAVGTNHSTLNNFAKTGDASNFVTGQVKYVKNDATGSNNGSSWANAFTNLQSALTATTCNDFFEVYVAKSNTFYKPAAPNGAANISFNIPTGMRIYGGFAGTEKSINQRNLALIHNDNKTTLSGDLGSNDAPFIFSTRTIVL
jgi:Concanavalin A-like lectin/glucanases superfamily